MFFLQEYATQIENCCATIGIERLFIGANCAITQAQKQMPDDTSPSVVIAVGLTSEVLLFVQQHLAFFFGPDYLLPEKAILRCVWYISLVVALEFQEDPTKLYEHLMRFNPQIQSEASVTT